MAWKKSKAFCEISKQLESERKASGLAFASSPTRYDSGAAQKENSKNVSLNLKKSANISQLVLEEQSVAMLPVENIRYQHPIGWVALSQL